MLICLKEVAANFTDKQWEEFIILKEKCVDGRDVA